MSFDACPASRPILSVNSKFACVICDNLLAFAAKLQNMCFWLMDAGSQTTVL